MSEGELSLLVLLMCMSVYCYNSVTNKAPAILTANLVMDIPDYNISLGSFHLTNDVTHLTILCKTL